MDKPGLRIGAQNLLCTCAGAAAGDRVLIVGEADPDPYFEPELVEELGRSASELGMEPNCILATSPASTSDLPADIAEAMHNADVTVFLSRIGDRVRFESTHARGSRVMCYALTREYMSSGFGTADYEVTEATLERLMDRISVASGYRIRTRDGTDLTAELMTGSMQSDILPFALKLFPTMIFPPIKFRCLNGVLVIDHFTLSSSTRPYENSVLMISSPVIATVEDSVITACDGDPQVVRAFRNQCERAAAITGGEPFRLNSWHTGVNPNTFYDGNPLADLERWGTVAFGSPRYTHIHMAGSDPGDLSVQIFDASIRFDKDWLWKEGRFVFLDMPEIREILERSGQVQLSSASCFDIGIEAMRQYGKGPPGGPDESVRE